MKKTVCDLCGEEINEYAIESPHYKIKRHWSDPYGSGWEKLDAHGECIQAVAAAARERSEKRNGRM